MTAHNDFEKILDRRDEVSFQHQDDRVVVTAEEVAAGDWRVDVVHPTQGTLADLGNFPSKEQATGAMRRWMQQYGTGGRRQESVLDCLRQAFTSGRGNGGSGRPRRTGGTDGDTTTGLGGLFGDRDGDDGDSPLARMREGDSATGLFDDERDRGDGDSIISSSLMDDNTSIIGRDRRR